ncbi:MAG: MFS transporter [Alphaproteobacteria bacterium]
MNDTSNASDPADRPALLRDRSFVRLWSVGALIMAMRWFEILATSVFTFSVTQSALAVALVNLARAAPNLFFGAFTGALADRFDRRRLLLTGEIVLVAVTSVLFFLAAIDVISPWHIAIGAFLNGVVFTMEFPVRRNMMGDIAGIDRIGRAMGLDLTANNATRIVGPALGGFVLETIGIAGVYALATFCYVLCAVLVFGVISPARPVAAISQGLFAHVIDGLRYVRGQPALVGFMLITVIMNIWGLPYVAMVPVIGAEELNISAFPIGLLLSSEGVGALLGSLLAAAYAKPIHFRKTYLYGSILLIVAVIAFSQSDNYALSLVFTFAVGLGIAGFTTMQATLSYVEADPAMRARVMGVLAVCIGSGPIGMLHLGLLANWLDAPTALAVMGVEGLIALGIVMWIWKEVR